MENQQCHACFLDFDPEVYPDMANFSENLLYIETDSALLAYKASMYLGAFCGITERIRFSTYQSH